MTDSEERSDGTEPTPSGALPPGTVERAMARRALRRRVSFLGCGCLVVFGVVGIFLLVVVYQGTKNMAADFADPEARTRKVLALLGAEKLPEGYHAVLAVDVPLPFDMVVLSDEPWLLEDLQDEAPAPGLPTFNGLPGSKLFYYIHIHAEDRTGNDPFARELVSEETLDRGDLRIHGQRVAWEAHRGSALRPDGRAPGVFSRLRLECDDRQTRRAVWFFALPPGESELKGTPVDPEALRTFLEHFDVCPAEEEGRLPV